MNKNIQIKPLLVMIFFVAQVILNWLFILWVQNQPDITLNAWSFVLPILGYFYFTFALIGCIALLYKMKIGLVLTYIVLMFGVAASVISYNLILKGNHLIDSMIVPLIIVNIFVIMYIASNHDYFEVD